MIANKLEKRTKLNTARMMEPFTKDMMANTVKIIKTMKPLRVILKLSTDDLQYTNIFYKSIVL